MNEWVDGWRKGGKDGRIGGGGKGERGVHEGREEKWGKLCENGKERGGGAHGVHTSCQRHSIPCNLPPELTRSPSSTREIHS